MNSLVVTLRRDKRLLVKSLVSQGIRSRDLLICRRIFSNGAMSDSGRGSFYLYIDYESISLSIIEVVSLLLVSWKMEHCSDVILVVMATEQSRDVLDLETTFRSSAFDTGSSALSLHDTRMCLL